MIVLEEEVMKEQLWTKNYTCIILGTIVSAVGGVGLSLALSVTIYSQTQSTWLTGLYSALTLVPSIVLPVLISPLIDRYSRKAIIVNSDRMMGILFLLFAYLTQAAYFNFYLYLAIGLVININGLVYNLAYSSLFPNLIPKGMMQKGYAIGSTIYPLTNVLILPVATVIFKTHGVAALFLGEGLMLLLAAFFENKIKLTEKKSDHVEARLKRHFQDIKAGFKYLHKDKGIWYVYGFFVVMMFSHSIQILIYPYFEQASHLDVVDYALVLSFESAGYMVGGFLHYFIKIPTAMRYGLSVFVYIAFAVLGGAFFYMPLFLMVITKFFLGFIGMNSANIRVTSINHKIQDDMRGRLNAVFQTMVCLASMVGKLVAGCLGEWLTIHQVGLIYGGFIGLGTWFLIIRQKVYIKALYNQKV